MELVQQEGSVSLSLLATRNNLSESSSGSDSTVENELVIQY